MYLTLVVYPQHKITKSLFSFPLTKSSTHNNQIHINISDTFIIQYESSFHFCPIFSWSILKINVILALKYYAFIASLDNTFEMLKQILFLLRKCKLFYFTDFYMWSFKKKFSSGHKIFLGHLLTIVLNNIKSEDLNCGIVAI